MGWTDFNSPNVLTTNRGSEETLIQIILKTVYENMDEIKEGNNLPIIAKKVAWNVDNFYMGTIVIESYKRGLEDGFHLREMTFEALEKRIRQSGPLLTQDPQG